MPIIKQFIRSPDAVYNLPSQASVRKTIGQRVKAARQKHGMSQIELAQNLGKKSAAYIAFVESGQRNISAVDLSRLAVHLGEDLSSFYP